MIYEFTLSEVGDAIIHAIKANPSLDVRIIWDSSSVNVTGSQYSKLLSAGINIHIDHRGGIMHDKVAIIDDHIVITGSFNWSQVATEVNRENLIVIDSVVVASSYEQNFQQNYAATK
jgi:phosphatidylserine/phosphatidylglycerophosphate/cardiolipin synthase-like enzyme